jgi:NADH pyrophosphatase NudC (nudix superfamily)
MEYAGGDMRDHDTEVHDCRWFPMDEAIEIDEYKDEKGILVKAKAVLKLP